MQLSLRSFIGGTHLLLKTDYTLIHSGEYSVMFPLGCGHSMLWIQITARIASYVCFFVETVRRNEDKAKLGEALAKLGEAQAKLIAVEHIFQEDHVKIAALEVKLVTTEKAYQEDHDKHSLQIHEQQKENALILDEKRKLEKKLEELQSEVQQHTKDFHSIVPAQG